MEDKAYEEIKERIKVLIAKWSWIATSWGWKFDVYYHRAFEEMPDEADTNTDAITYCNFIYLEGGIYFNVAKCESKTDDELEHLVVHELTHFLVNPIQTDTENLIEYSVTTISRILIGLYNSQSSV